MNNGTKIRTVLRIATSLQNAVRIGDCILFNYKRAGITNVKAKVISQSISCITGCMVEEAAMYTTKLWR